MTEEQPATNSQPSYWAWPEIVCIVLILLAVVIYWKSVVVSGPPAIVSQIANTKRSLSTLLTGVDLWRQQVGGLPPAGRLYSSLFEDQAALSSPIFISPSREWAKRKNAFDAWGQAIIYRVNSSSGNYTIYSVGPNGTDEMGEGDDVFRKEHEQGSGYLNPLHFFSNNLNTDSDPPNPDTNEDGPDQPTQ